jgi:hypothetical protein
MTLRKVYVVVCDGKCGRRAEGTFGYLDDSGEARSVARQKGWLRVPRPAGPNSQGADYCPFCRYDHEHDLELREHPAVTGRIPPGVKP